MADGNEKDFDEEFSGSADVTTSNVQDISLEGVTARKWGKLPDDIFFEHLPPGLDKGEAKATRQSKFGVCGEYGHRRGSAKCRYTGAKTRKRCRKVNAKVGAKPKIYVDDDDQRGESSVPKRRRRPIFVE